MKKIFLILLCLLPFIGAYYVIKYLTGLYLVGTSFILGTILGVLLMNIILFSKNRKINSYARELEKESISSEENLSRVKVLESKIVVLEKALENALKNK